MSRAGEGDEVSVIQNFKFVSRFRKVALLSVTKKRRGERGGVWTTAGNGRG